MGLVAVAVLDESGIQYSGYSKRDCVLFDSDSISHKVTWEKTPTLDELKGKTIRLNLCYEFVFYSTKCYMDFHFS